MRRFIFSLAVAVCCAVSVPAFAQQAMGTSAMPSCTSGDPVVWVNTSTKKYHMQGDAYFGKTKHGAYMCKSAADAKSYSAAGMKSMKHSAASSSGTASDSVMSPDASPAPSGKTHKHHRHHGTPASPSPAMMPSPAAT